MKKLWATLKEKWAEYIFEILVIALSIFAGLELENWNEERKDSTRKRQYYELLLVDIQNDINAIKNIMNEINDDMRGVRDYYKRISQKHVSKQDIIQEMRVVNFDYTGITFNTNTFETLRSTGDFGLMSTDIQALLLEINRAQQSLYDMTNINDNNWQNIHFDAEQEGFILLEDWLDFPEKMKNDLLPEDLTSLILKVETSIQSKYWNDDLKLSIYEQILIQSRNLEELIEDQL